MSYAHTAMKAIREADAKALRQALFAGGALLAEHLRQDVEALYAAMRSGDIDCLRQILALGADPSRADDQGGDAFMLAASEGFVDGMREIWNSRDAKRVNVHGCSALLLAAQEGELAAVKMLWSESDHDARDVNGYGPLLRAAQCDTPELALWMIRHGADPASRVTPEKDRALALKKLRLHSSHEGFTPLMCASWLGREENVRALIPHCSATARDALGRTALMVAIAHGKVECAKLLMPVSDPHARDARGFSASRHATERLSDGYSRPELSELGARLLAWEERELLSDATPKPHGPGAQTRL